MHDIRIHVSAALLSIALAACAGEPAADSTSVQDVTAAASTCAATQLCCAQAVSATSAAIQPLLALLGVSAPLDQLVGLTCSAISAESCTRVALCCTTSVGSVLAVGCTPD